ncbi:MAG TPA: hypothetical protein VF105_07265 [Gemmatimonadaceae bacterium]
MKLSHMMVLSALVSAFAVPAAAQVGSPVTTPSASSATAPTVGGPADVWSAKSFGAFRVTLDMPTHSMTANVTVKEVDGKLMATVWPVGDNEGRDFDAAVMGNQLMIGGQTPHGLFKLTVEHRGSSVSGTWSFGEQKGALTGEIAK